MDDPIVGNTRYFLKRPTPTSRETDEAAQAELETEAEAASSSFFHTEKGAFA